MLSTSNDSGSPQLASMAPAPSVPLTAHWSSVDTGEDRQRNPSAFKRGAGVWGNTFSSKLGWVQALDQLDWYYTWWSAEPDASVADFARQQDIEFVPMMVRNLWAGEDSAFAML
jgi:hypothetical protein